MMQIFEGKSWAYSLECQADNSEVRQYLLNVHPQPFGTRAVSDLWHERQIFFTQSYVFNLHMPGRSCL